MVLGAVGGGLSVLVNLKFKGSLAVFSGLSASSHCCSVSGVRQPFCVKDEKNSACLFGKENAVRQSKAISQDLFLYYPFFPD